MPDTKTNLQETTPMQAVDTPLYSFSREERGQDLVEYSLLLAFIALAAIAVLPSVHDAIYNIWISGFVAVWDQFAVS